MKPALRLAMGAIFALAACVPTEEANRTPRYTLVMGIDVISSRPIFTFPLKSLNDVLADMPFPGVPGAENGGRRSGSSSKKRRMRLAMGAIFALAACVPTEEAWGSM